MEGDDVGAAEMVAEVEEEGEGGGGGVGGVERGGYGGFQRGTEGGGDAAPQVVAVYV